MPSRSKKKGHTHGKHKHKHTTATSHDAETTLSTTSASSPRTGVAFTGTNPTDTSNARRNSMCEYCGAGSLTTDGYDDDNFDCVDDCERYAMIDINAVTSTDAYELRLPHLTAFYCQCGIVVSEIHAFIRLVSATNDVRSVFTEHAVLTIRPKLLALLKTMWRLGVGGAGPGLSTAAAPYYPDDDGDEAGDAASQRGPTCPFVMVLSVLLPALHKFLQFTQLTKLHWWLGTRALSLCPVSAAVELLATQVQLHDVLTHVILDGDRLANLIDASAERDHDITRLAQPTPLTPRRSGACSSSFSSSSVASSSYSHPGSATDRDAAFGPFPQIKKIAFEFDEWLAECKFELAELSEAMLENVEITALGLSRLPPFGVVTGGGGKPSANEMVASLIKELLVPLSARVVQTPSVSRSYIFPRLLDRCVSVTIDEYAVETGKWTAQTIAPLEKAIELFRSWGSSIDAEYDQHRIAAQRDVARLSLLTTDAYRRLDLLLQAWRGISKDSGPHVPRLMGKTNWESLRSTLKKATTARGGGSSGLGLSQSQSQNQRSPSGLSCRATPPPSVVNEQTQPQ